MTKTLEHAKNRRVVVVDVGAKYVQNYKALHKALTLPTADKLLREALMAEELYAAIRPYLIDIVDDLISEYDINIMR